MISRVFCYSDLEAEKNGNKDMTTKTIFLILAIVVSGLIGLLSLYILKIINDDDFTSLSIFFAVTIIAIFALASRSKYGARLTAFAIDSNGKLYQAVHIGDEIVSVVTGGATGFLLDQVVNGGNSAIFEDLGTIIGSYMAYKKRERALKLMVNPEFIAKLIENARNIQGANIYSFEKIYSISENNNSLTIICDYMNVRTGKIEIKKKLNILKSFNSFDDLKNHIYNYQIKGAQ